MIKNNEQIYSIREGKETFHVFVPFVPKGEFVGAIYIKNIPDFTFISKEIIVSYDETAVIFASLILLGLLAMFYISSYTVKERDETQKQLFQEQEKHLLDKIHHEKESLFTKRIYHTHHKAEKVMGFIKEDLRSMNPDNIDEINYRVTKYANFISRVIYDMKWYDPPLQTIRNPLFRTDLNEVIKFIVQNLFLRISDKTGTFDFKLNLNDDLPEVTVNEFVVWEILEPLIQNSIDHGGGKKTLITIESKYQKETNKSEIKIIDNGKGIPSEMLELSDSGIRKIFLENISSKENSHNSGYGCYLAHEISEQRCGWDLDVENLASGGCCFTLTIPNI
ncbi:MAG: HAMP domain-containing sensor histidine kinase [Calditrichota bacterium]